MLFSKAHAKSEKCILIYCNRKLSHGTQKGCSPHQNRSQHPLAPQLNLKKPSVPPSSNRNIAAPPICDSFAMFQVHLCWRRRSTCHETPYIHQGKRCFLLKCNQYILKKCKLLHGFCGIKNKFTLIPIEKFIYLNLCRNVKAREVSAWRKFPLKKKTKFLSTPKNRLKKPQLDFLFLLFFDVSFLLLLLFLFLRKNHGSFIKFCHSYNQLYHFYKSHKNDLTS